MLCALSVRIRLFTKTNQSIGRPKYSKVMTGALDADHFVGNQAEKNRGLLRLKYPITHGIVEDWDDMELIWSHIYSDSLRISSEEHPLLITEAPLNPVANRDKTAQVFFETYSCPALYFAIQAVLSLYASGRTTGCVLDSGDGVSHVVPVYEGFSLPSAIRRIDVAGRDVTENLSMLLRRAGYPLLSSAELEIVRTIKEKHCFVSNDPRKEEYEWSGYMVDESKAFEQYKLPDGKVVKLGPERFRAPEILFDPLLIGSEFPGIHEIVLEAISKTDLDLRPSLYQSIVLSGGSTMYRGFGDRLLRELKEQVGNGTKIKIYAPPERKFSTWIGGSILAGLSTFKKIWVTNSEYQEDPSSIHRKCL